MLEVFIHRAIFAMAALSLLPAALADKNTDLLSAAAAGMTGRVEMLLDSGARLDSKDKNGRTPLMLAAQHGHADIVRVLLSKGATGNTRDKEGWTAYGLALFSPAFGASRENLDAVLQVLPHPAPVRLIVDAATNPENLVSSCFMGSRQELAGFVGGIRLDALAISDFEDMAGASGDHLIQIVRAQSHGIDVPRSVPTEDAGAVLSLEVIPASSCSQSSNDSLSLSIDVRIFRARDHKLLLQKTFGGGLTGLHSRSVTNPSQYPEIYEDWVRSHSGAIFHAVLTALIKSPM